MARCGHGSTGQTLIDLPFDFSPSPSSPSLFPTLPLLPSSLTVSFSHHFPNFHFIHFLLIHIFTHVILFSIFQLSSFFSVSSFYSHFNSFLLLLLLSFPICSFPSSPLYLFPASAIPSFVLLLLPCSLGYLEGVQ